MYDLYTKSRASLNGRRCDANVMERNTNEMRNIQALVLVLIRWCGREDLNLHAYGYMHLKHARLPIPPRPQNRLALARTPTSSLCGCRPLQNVGENPWVGHASRCSFRCRDSQLVNLDVTV